MGTVSFISTFVAPAPERVRVVIFPLLEYQQTGLSCEARTGQVQRFVLIKLFGFIMRTRLLDCGIYGVGVLC